MIRRCSWCGLVFGEKEPLDDHSYTDTICDPCMIKELGITQEELEQKREERGN